MTDRYKTIGKAISCTHLIEDRRIAGFMFRIELLDETMKVLPYYCYLYSENETKSRYGNKRLAELCLATNVTTITDTDELLQIEFIVIHNGNSIKAMRAIEQPKPKPKRSIMQRILRKD